MNDIATAPFSAGTLVGPVLTHRQALEHRAAGVPLSACEGNLTFLGYARPGWSNTPQVRRCDRCAAVLFLSERDDAVLWVLPTNGGVS